MRFAGITYHTGFPHVTGGNERWPHCGGQCRTRSTLRKAAKLNLVDDDVDVNVIWWNMISVLVTRVNTASLPT